MRVCLYCLQMFGELIVLVAIASTIDYNMLKYCIRVES